MRRPPVPLRAAAASASAAAGGGGLSKAELAGRLQGQVVLAPLTRGGHLPFRRLCADFGAEVLWGEMAFAREMLRFAAAPFPPSSSAERSVPKAGVAPPPWAITLEGARERVQAAPIPGDRTPCPPGLFHASLTDAPAASCVHARRGSPKEKALLKRAQNERTFGVQIATNRIDEGVGAARMAVAAGADFVDLNCKVARRSAARAPGLTRCFKVAVRSTRSQDGGWGPGCCGLRPSSRGSCRASRRRSPRSP